MNLLKPVSTIMTSDLITVNPKDPLAEVKRKFDESNIHHILVVRYKTLVGMISKSDFLFFLRGFAHNDMDRLIEEARLNAFKAEELMITKLAKLTSNEPIRTAVELFKINRFHALPIVDDEQLVGIITTHDIIKALADDPIELRDYENE